MLLAGDLGGTKTRLGLFRSEPERPEPTHVRDYATLAFPSLGDMVGAFLKTADMPHAEVDAACFGVAGPARADRFVGRIGRRPAHVAGLDRLDPAHLVVHRFETPETAARQRGDVFSVFHGKTL